VKRIGKILRPEIGIGVLIPPDFPYRKRGGQGVGRVGFPYGKGGFDVSGGGGRVRHHLMNPGPYRPLSLILVGMVRRGGSPPPAKGEFNAAQWSPASLGTVR